MNVLLLSGATQQRKNSPKSRQELEAFLDRVYDDSGTLTPSYEFFDGGYNMTGSFGYWVFYLWRVDRDSGNVVLPGITLTALREFQ